MLLFVLIEQININPNKFKKMIVFISKIKIFFGCYWNFIIILNKNINWIKLFPKGINRINIHLLVWKHFFKKKCIDALIIFVFNLKSKSL